MSESVDTSPLAESFARELLQRLGANLVRVSLFGSRARGDHRFRSDYDFMIVVREATGEARSAIHGLATSIELERPVDLSTKILDSATFERLSRSAMPFWRNFARDERLLWQPTNSANG